MDNPPIEKDIYQEPVYTIGHAAEKLGIAVPTLRMYEKAGLILPYKTPTKRRLYSRHDIDYLKIIIDLIRNQRLNIEGIRRLLALTPCWKIIHCPKEIRKKCPSYTEGSIPCWLMAQNPCGKTKDQCRTCEVYLSCPKILGNPIDLVKI